MLLRMAGLLCCPFCRELYAPEEGPVCPHCDLELVELGSLPLSPEAQQEAASWGQLDPPEDQKQSPLFWRRGRAALPLFACLGLILFFQPWVTLERPDPVGLSGFDLARSNAPWLWGGAVGWFLTVPLVLSRRSINELRGIRIIAATFSVMTLGETVMLRFLPPAESVYFTSGLGWAWGLYASAVVSLTATIVASRLGGSVEDLRDLPAQGVPEAHQGEPLH